MKLKDRVAIVTGAGSGIGQATALLFAAEGAKVAVVDLKPDAARAVAEQIERAGGAAMAIAADVSRAEDNREAVAQTVVPLGPARRLLRQRRRAAVAVAGGRGGRSASSTGSWR